MFTCSMNITKQFLINSESTEFILLYCILTSVPPTPARKSFRYESITKQKSSPEEEENCLREQHSFCRWTASLEIEQLKRMLGDIFTFSKSRATRVMSKRQRTPNSAWTSLLSKGKDNRIIDDLQSSSSHERWIALELAWKLQGKKEKKVLEMPQECSQHGGFILFFPTDNVTLDKRGRWRIGKERHKKGGGGGGGERRGVEGQERRSHPHP